MSKPSGCLRMMSSVEIAIDPSVHKETIVLVRRQGGRGGVDVFFFCMACTTFFDHIISAVHGQFVWCCVNKPYKRV